MTDFTIIGKPVPMVDGSGKVTGRGIYTDDMKMSWNAVCAEFSEAFIRMQKS